MNDRAAPHSPAITPTPEDVPNAQLMYANTQLKRDRDAPYGIPAVTR